MYGREWQGRDALEQQLEHGKSRARGRETVVKVGVDARDA
jgi:hypothetical protein